MTKNRSRRPHGHCCKICGEYKANEKFSDKGHAAHICKVCSRLSAAEKAEAMTINRLHNLSLNRLGASDKAWLENRLHDRHPEVAELAKEICNGDKIRIGRGRVQLPARRIFPLTRSFWRAFPCWSFWQES